MPGEDSYRSSQSTPCILERDSGGNASVAPKVDIVRCDVVGVLVVSLVDVVIDEGLEQSLEVARREVVLEQGAFLLVSDASVRFYLGFVDDLAHRASASCRPRSLAIWFQVH